MSRRSRPAVNQLSLFDATSCTEDFPANRTRRRGSGAGGKTKGTSGRTSHESSASSDPLGFSLRMFLAFASQCLTKYSKTWKDSGTTCGRSWWVLMTLEPRTEENGSGLSVAWTTPQAHDCQGLPDANRVGRYGTKHGGKNLLDDVAILQTPSSGLAEAGARSRSGNRKGEKLLAGQAMESWPTPQTADAWVPTHTTENTLRRGDPSGSIRSNSGNLAKEVAGLLAPASPSTSGKPRGSLNPAWVAQLMAVPDGWLDLPESKLFELWETRSFGLSRT